MKNFAVLVVATLVSIGLAAPVAAPGPEAEAEAAPQEYGKYPSYGKYGNYGSYGGSYANYGRYKRNAKPEADADIDALLDAALAIKKKRQGYGQYGSYGTYAPPPGGYKDYGQYGKYGKYTGYPRMAAPEPGAAPEAEAASE